MVDQSKKKGIAILGSTGNIGVQALDVISAFPEYFDLIIISASTNAKLLIDQAMKHKPKMVFIADKQKKEVVRLALQKEPIVVLETEMQFYDAFYQDSLHLVLIAILGYAGLSPTLAAIEASKDIAIANKESLVVGGELLMQLANKKNVKIIPVDSEHSAIFQCLLGEEPTNIEKIILTASGGPFFNFSVSEMKTITLKQALKHPTWQMGKKITIDSASMMNKGLEAIEAKYLFALKPEQIEVIVHPQSVIHSMVQFVDGSIKAQMSPPDMRGPIHYALFHPKRIKASFESLNFLDYPSLSFSKVDTKIFRNLALAFEALRKGGNLPAVLNAANEAAVEAVLQNNLDFYRISEVVENIMSRMSFVNNPTLLDLQSTHHETIQKSNELIRKLKWKS